ncbi:hypothetical protein [Streptomyces sp. Ac-502]|uniref:hypothetical protein n=1 Tax=Streptomyces sp. Ac-502 TaxID=3342801 RepID=UPI003862C1BD
MSAASAPGVDRGEVRLLAARFLECRARYGEQHAHLVWGRDLLAGLGLSEGDRAYLYGTTGCGFMTALVEGIAAVYDAPAAALAEAARVSDDPAGIAVAYVVASLSLAAAVTS